MIVGTQLRRSRRATTMDGLIFGLVDNGVLLVGAYTGLEVEKFLPRKLQTGLGAVYGACIGNTVSDALGVMLDPSLQNMFTGVVLGCLIPIAFIPLLTRWVNRRDI